MKKLYFLIVTMIALACNHDVLDELNEDVMAIKENASVLHKGSFVSHNRYMVSGTANIIEKDGKAQLLFSSFSSSSGPDLKVLISKQLMPVSALELGDLKALSGNFSYDLPDGFKLEDHGPFVLVYCEQFARLFGSAELGDPN